MKKEYQKPICEVVKMETIAPIAASGISKIICPWTPWKRNIHWDDDGVGGWALNGSLDYDNGYPYVRSDNAEKWNYPNGEWYYTLEIVDH